MSSLSAILYQGSAAWSKYEEKPIILLITKILKINTKPYRS